MLRIARERQAAGVEPPAVAPAAPTAAAPSVARDVKAVAARWGEVVAELPCIFASREQPSRRVGDSLYVHMFEQRYVNMWAYAQENTGGAFAVRYAQGEYSKSAGAFAIWPSTQAEMAAGGKAVLGLSLGLYLISVRTIRPFPIVRLMAPRRERIVPVGAAHEEATPPEELERRLRALPTRREQRELLAGLSTGAREAFLHWLATEGSAGGAGEVPYGDTTPEPGWASTLPPASDPAAAGLLS